MIARDDFDAYSRALTVNADMAQEELARLYGAASSAMGSEDLRRAIHEIMPALSRKYGARAAAVAVEFYMRQRGAAGVDEPYEAVAFEGPADSEVHAAAAAAISSATSAEALGSTLSGQLVRHVNAAADETIVGNARHDPAHPRWALVPHAGACGFCLLIASRGFDYSREGRVARHNGCKCSTVADFDTENPALEGYSEDAASDLYSRAAADMEPVARERWGAMSDAKRARHTHGRGASYDAFKRNLIAARMGELTGHVH